MGPLQFSSGVHSAVAAQARAAGAASMGPLQFSSGVMMSTCAMRSRPVRTSFNGAAAVQQRSGAKGVPVSQLDDQLQWGRCSSAAECRRRWRPRRARRFGFNGAAAVQQRSDSQGPGPGEASLPPLQWGRCSSAAEWRTTAGRRDIAEMLLLQWGRCSSAAECRTLQRGPPVPRAASMGPLQFSSGVCRTRPR